MTGKDLRPDFPKTRFVGVFRAGAIGRGLGIAIDTQGKTKKQVGATINSVNAEVVSFCDIPLRDFNGAIFSIGRLDKLLARRCYSLSE